MTYPILISECRIPCFQFICNCNSQCSRISMKYVSAWPTHTNVQDSGRIIFSMAFNMYFVRLSSTNTVLLTKYLPSKPKTKYFQITFRNICFSMPFTFRDNTFQQLSCILITSLDSWPRILIGFTTKSLKRKVTYRFGSGYSHGTLDSDICYIAKLSK